MVDIIVKFLEAILTIAAALIVVVFFIVGLHLGGNFLFATLGLLFGFIVAAVLLGIPILLLRINQNLEAIRARLPANTSAMSRE